jgi:hypothetical protein
VAVFFLLAGCKSNPANSKEKPVSEKAVPASQPQPVAQEKLPPPTRQDVQDAVHRVFGDDVVISSRISPAFIVGDFNGDEIQDVAVVVEPVAAKLGHINGEFANWTIQDANQFFLPAPGVHVVNPPVLKPAHVEKNEMLLAIIHGFGPSAWRSSDARQSYLVKHAAATFVGTSRSFSEKYIRAMKLSVQTDVIKARRNSKPGYFFWTGSNYAWHPENG